MTTPLTTVTVPVLSPVEQRVAALLCEDRRNKEIAALLGVGVRTVETHREHIYAKLGVHSVLGLYKLLNPISRAE